MPKLWRVNVKLLILQEKEVKPEVIQEIENIPGYDGETVASPGEPRYIFATKEEHKETALTRAIYSRLMEVTKERDALQETIRELGQMLEEREQ